MTTATTETLTGADRSVPRQQHRGARLRQPPILRTGATPTLNPNPSQQAQSPLADLAAGYPVPISTLSHWQTESADSDIHDWIHDASRGVPEEAETVIIGAGISGATAAYYSLFPEEDGGSDASSGTPSDLPTVLLEARSATSGATGRNGGHVRPDSFAGFPHYSSLFGSDQATRVLKNEKETLQLMQELVDSNPGLEKDCGFWRGRTFAAYLSETQKDRGRKAYQTYQSAGHLQEGDGPGQVEWIEDPEKAREMTGIPDVVGAAGFEAGSVYPLRFVHALLRKCISQRGLQLFTHTPAYSMQRLHDPTFRWTVKTNRGEVKARKVLLATNGYSTVLHPPLKEFLTPHRAQCSAILPPSNLGGPGPVDASQTNRLPRTYSISSTPTNYCYLTQRPNDDGGYWILGGGHHLNASEEQIGVFDDSVAHDNVTEYLAEYPEKTFSAWQAGQKHATGSGKQPGLTQVWTGIQGYTRDSVPIIGEVPSDLLGQQVLDETSSVSTGLFLDLGHHGHGMARAVTCARGVARLMRQTMGNDAKDIGDETWQEFTGLPAVFRWSQGRIDRAMQSGVDCRFEY